MSHEDQWFEEADDEYDDEFPEADFDDELTETVPCPNCGIDVYEDAVQCPACGTYVTHATDVLSGRPAWWILLGFLGVLATVLALAVW